MRLSPENTVANDVIRIEDGFEGNLSTECIQNLIRIISSVFHAEIPLQ